MTIADYGWNTYQTKFTGADPTDENQHMRPGRVVTESAQLYRISVGDEENLAILTGSLLNTLAEKTDFPAVGDWVNVDTNVDHQHWIIREILPRYSTLMRKAAGITTEAQLLASNVDLIFVVNGLDGGRNFNLRGIERYVTLCWESGAEPVVVLNKADLCDDVESAVLQAESVAPGARVLAVSALTGMGFDEVTAIAQPGKTVVLIGRSGVGKSSIINQLAGEEVMYTGGQRENDLRGRHTTTHRELVRLGSGALLIDTPGLREVQLWAGEESVASAFPEIDEHSEECRFRDCSHSREPGCAVQAAVASGDIEQSRFESYLDMQRELRYLRLKQDEKSRKQLQARNKAIAKGSRQMKKMQRRSF